MSTPVPTKEDVIRHLTQLRATLAHALTQPNISPKRFNEIREQLAPLDAQLHWLGVDTLPTIPQMQPTYVRPSRFQLRQHKRAGKFTQRVMAKVGSIGK